MAGQTHVDTDTQAQIEAKNVVVLQMKELPSIDVHKHNYFTTSGVGKGWLFQNGQAINVTWSKKDRDSRIVISDASGKEVKFVRGKIWISVVALDNTPTF
jgi:hypothetical protein